MQVSFKTKAQSKREQEEAFMKLTPSERMEAFFRLSRRMLRFPTKAEEDFKDNFVIRKDDTNQIEQ